MYILQKRINKHILIVFTLVFMGLNTHAQINEYEVKTSFLLKFAKYTEWPANNNKEFIISVIGTNPFDDLLEKLSESKTIKGQIIKIRNIDNVSEIDNSNIIFIPRNEKRIISEVLKYCKKKPILVISESPNAAKEGTHINFYVNRDKKIRFEVNIEQLKNSNLKMSSNLIDIANTVN